jgi:hypothetical protein
VVVAISPAKLNEVGVMLSVLDESPLVFIVVVIV